MAPGPKPTVNHDEAFLWWYNEGNRRSLSEVAENYGVSVTTAKAWSRDNTWADRADEIDAEAREQVNRRLANVIARQRTRNIEAVAAVQTLFFQRLRPGTPDNPNPAQLRPEDVGIQDYERLVKLFELLVGGVTERVDSRPRVVDTPLSELEREIAELDIRLALKAIPPARSDI